MPYDDEGVWTMPDWMKPYRDLIERGGGGSTAEDLMTRLEQEENLAFSNQVVAGLAIHVAAKIQLLRALRAEGLLREEKLTDLFTEGWFRDVIFEAREGDRSAGIYSANTDEALAEALATALQDTLRLELREAARA